MQAVAPSRSRRGTTLRPASSGTAFRSPAQSPSTCASTAPCVLHRGVCVGCTDTQSRKTHRRMCRVPLAPAAASQRRRRAPQRLSVQSAARSSDTCQRRAVAGPVRIPCHPSASDVAPPPLALLALAWAASATLAQYVWQPPAATPRRARESLVSLFSGPRSRRHARRGRSGLHATRKTPYRVIDFRQHLRKSI